MKRIRKAKKVREAKSLNEGNIEGKIDKLVFDVRKIGPLGIHRLTDTNNSWLLDMILDDARLQGVHPDNIRKVSLMFLDRTMLVEYREELGMPEYAFDIQWDFFVNREEYLDKLLSLAEERW